MKKKFNLPKSFYCDIPYGEESQGYASMSVPTVIFSSIGGGYIIYYTYNHGILILGLIAVLVLTVLATLFIRWFIRQLDILAELRREAVKKHQAAQTFEEKKASEKEFERLCINKKDIKGI